MKILFVAFQFPPRGGAGVHRSINFVKTLPKFGYKPIVFTISSKDVYKMNEIVDENHIGASIKFRELVTTYSENKDLLMMGGYTQGQDPILDQAITAWPKITEFIKQKESKKEDFNSSSSQLMQMFGG